MRTESRNEAEKLPIVYRIFIDGMCLSYIAQMHCKVHLQEFDHEELQEMKEFIVFIVYISATFPSLSLRYNAVADRSRAGAAVSGSR